MIVSKNEMGQEDNLQHFRVTVDITQRVVKSEHHTATFVIPADNLDDAKKKTEGMSPYKLHDVEWDFVDDEIVDQEIMEWRVEKVEPTTDLRDFEPEDLEPE